MMAPRWRVLLPGSPSQKKGKKYRNRCQKEPFGSDSTSKPPPGAGADRRAGVALPEGEAGAMRKISFMFFVAAMLVGVRVHTGAQGDPRVQDQKGAKPRPQKIVPCLW